MVTIYADCEFDGVSAGLGEGRYDADELAALGIPDYTLSSIRVESGFEAVLYWESGFRGDTLVRTQDDNCLDDDGGWNDEVSSIVVRKASGTDATARQIEAEDFTAMNGVRTQACSEGGENVGWTDRGDWLTYADVRFPTTGEYVIEYRVASNIATGGKFSVDLNAGDVELGEVQVPNTGGWQEWTTVSQTVSVAAGTYPLSVFVEDRGFNLNWIRVTSGELEARGTESLAAPTVFPNPATSTITVRGLAPDAGIRIIDMLGRPVLETTARENIDIQSLSAGQYVLKSSGRNPIFFIKKQ